MKIKMGMENQPSPCVKVAIIKDRRRHSLDPDFWYSEIKRWLHVALGNGASQGRALILRGRVSSLGRQVHRHLECLYV